MGRAKRVLTALSWAVLLGFALTLALGFFVPLYTDEIGAKMQLMRVFAEGGRAVSLLPQCTASFSLPIVVTWYPAAALYGVLLSSVGLMGLKISGILMALLWFGLVALAIRRTTRDRDARVRRFALFVAVHAIGVVPLTLVLARSEGVLVFAIALFVVFPFVWSIPSRQTWWGRLLVTLGFIVLTSVFYFSHPKTLLFTPLLLLSAAFTFGVPRSMKRVQWAWGLLAVVFVLGCALQTHGRVKRMAACEAPRVRGVFSSITLEPGLAWRDPLQFLATGTKNVRKHFDDVAESMVLSPTPASSWLPGVPVSITTKRLNAVSQIVLYGIQIVVPLLFLASLRRARDARTRKHLAFSAVLFASLALHVFLASHWNFYMSAFVIAVLAMVGGLSLHILSSDERALRLASRVAPVTLGALFVISLISMAATLVYLGPPLIALARMEGTLIPGQLASAPIFGMADEHVKIREHARRCGIEGDGARHLVIDDVTLFAFERLREPLHIIYVTDAAMWGLDMPGEKDLAFLRQMESPGIISRCSWLPTLLVSKAQREGSYCCVSAEDLRSAPPPSPEGQ